MQNEDERQERFDKSMEAVRDAVYGCEKQLDRPGMFFDLLETERVRTLTNRVENQAGWLMDLRGQAERLRQKIRSLEKHGERQADRLREMREKLRATRVRDEPRSDLPTIDSALEARQRRMAVAGSRQSVNLGPCTTLDPGTLDVRTAGLDSAADESPPFVLEGTTVRSREDGGIQIEGPFALWSELWVALDVQGWTKVRWSGTPEDLNRFRMIAERAGPAPPLDEKTVAYLPTATGGVYANAPRAKSEEAPKKIPGLQTEVCPEISKEFLNHIGPAFGRKAQGRSLQRFLKSGAKAGWISDLPVSIGKPGEGWAYSPDEDEPLRALPPGAEVLPDGRYWIPQTETGEKAWEIKSPPFREILVGGLILGVLGSLVIVGLLSLGTYLWRLL